MAAAGRSHWRETAAFESRRGAARRPRAVAGREVQACAPALTFRSLTGRRWQSVWGLVDRSRFARAGSSGAHLRRFRPDPNVAASALLATPERGLRREWT